MTTDQIVIVTGARILADDQRSVAWAREILSRELASATLVVAGDARGPDQWAHEIAQGMVAPIDCERWTVAGRIEHRFAALGSWSGIGRWDASATPIGDRRPLARNAAMVQFFARAARMVALYHPDARTQGTAHTVSLARKAGIDVTEYVWGGAR